MKSFHKAGLHILFWIAIPLIILYFKWAAQNTTSLPGLSAPESESFFQIIKNNIDIFFVSLFGSIPVFYWSFFWLTPKLLFETKFLNILLFAAGLVVYFLITSSIAKVIFPMYFFFGTPFAIKVLPPIVLLSALGGSLFALMNQHQIKNL